MPSPRWLPLLRMFLVGVLAALPLACMQVVTSKTQTVVAAANAMCPVGSEGCPCTSGGGCDPGLYCSGGTCVSYGAEEYEFEDDMIEPQAAPVYDRTISVEGVNMSAGLDTKQRRRSRRGGGRMSKNTRSGDSAAAPVEYARAEPSGGDGQTSAPEAAPDAAEIERDPAGELDLQRQVIYTATLLVSVYDRDMAIEIAEDLPRRYGGWIDSRYDYTITLRIRAEHLFEAMRVLGELGVVLDKTLLAEDVTAEYVDLEARIRILEEMVRQLEALLAKAKDVEQALQIRAALDVLRIELEAARARMRQLSEMIDFSTLTVAFTPRGPTDELPSSNDPFPWVDTLGVESTEYR